MSMLDCALRYATKWAVFPCKPGAKVPACEHGCKDATRDAEQIRRWWTAMPEANIGIATGPASGIFVLDVDGDEGLEALVDIGEGIPGTLTQATPSGGLHLVFAYPAEVGNSARKLGPCLDTRGAGGYIVAAPSVHPNGGVYRWANRGEPQSVPGWLIRLIRQAPAKPKPLRAVDDDTKRNRYVQAALEREVADVAAAVPGTRNPTLNVAAYNLGTLVGAHALDAETAWSHLLAATAACGLPEREARKTITSGLTAGAANPRRIAS